ncbi:DEAD/DEAH box helicase [Neisseria meningitidis]|nr:DEAD/DEAH box helicase [Neisseria meningitidis]MBG8624890.1 DEAD/DEAH box helicase [Neisseria meningitidis]MBG8636264.1 DEAD/DEAH box helicase [Neisseria meningitidis]MBG8643887.1 DEAD/DEAH box helicase [Neisseria meningitidis]MBG8680144.1 DEAD/DEAH box helicase [Neisseria meningitidis]
MQDAVTINKRRRNYAVRITPPSRRQRVIITDCPPKNQTLLLWQSLKFDAPSPIGNIPVVQTGK